MATRPAEPNGNRAAADGGAPRSGPKGGRMSLAQLKADKQRRNKMRADVLSGDMSRSLDFEGPAKTRSDPGRLGSGSATPTRRRVHFSDDSGSPETLPRPADVSSADSSPDGPCASEPSTPTNSQRGGVYNAKGELQVAESTDGLAYDDEESLRVLAQSAGPGPRPRTSIRNSVILEGFDEHPAVANLPGAVARTRSDDRETRGDVRPAWSPCSSQDAEDDRGRGSLVQVDWMALSDDRYVRRADFDRLEVRSSPSRFFPPASFLSREGSFLRGRAETRGQPKADDECVLPCRGCCRRWARRWRSS